MPGSLRADDDDGGDVSFQVFYDNLQDQGTWIQTDDYGYVFQPAVTDDDWRPYTRGHWAYTDYGWTWVSDENFGWATYHYGRWVNIDDVGWVWVPGYRWAPAWVSWRHGGGYCGWAPLPPESFVGIDYRDRYHSYDEGSVSVDFHIGGDVDIAFGIGAGCYNFCPDQYMGDPYVHRHLVRPYDNYTVINRTTNITNINVTNNNNTIVNNNTVVNNYNTGGAAAFRNRNVPMIGGPNPALLHTNTPIQHYNITSSATPGTTKVQGNALAFYAPKVNGQSIANQSYRPRTVAQVLPKTQVNRGVTIDHPLRPSRMAPVIPPTPQQVQAAHQAQLLAPPTAKVITKQNPPASVPHFSQKNVVVPTHHIASTSNNNQQPQIHSPVVQPQVQFSQQAQQRQQEQAQAEGQQRQQQQAQAEALRRQQEQAQAEAQRRQQQQTEAEAQRRQQQQAEAEAQRRQQQQAEAEAQRRQQQQAQAEAQRRQQQQAQAEAQRRQQEAQAAAAEENRRRQAAAAAAAAQQQPQQQPQQPQKPYGPNH